MFCDSILIGKTSILRVGHISISNLMEFNIWRYNMGNVEKLASLLIEEPKREQLFPLFEEVFGITIQTLNDFSDKGYWDDTYKALSFLQEDKVIANVAAFSLPLLINGEK